ncbi:MAG: beta-galactosidase trimerization domain-containing protein [Pirellulales bacterium]|nr:beta-galactosidase trimerization domain-containing protein [Pirellulales bacterium]
MKARLWFTLGVALWLASTARSDAAEDGVFVRFRLQQPQGAKYYVKLGGYVHTPNWYFPAADIPADAEKPDHARVAAGEFTEWFDLAAHGGASLHGRQNLAGGVAEFPNVTARFVAEPESPRRSVEIELATAPDAAKVVKRWQERFEGDATSFLVSPNLAADAPQLELASEMTDRRLKWALDATGGERHAPKELLVQTSFWSPQRPELDLKEAKVLSLLGFNVVGQMSSEVRAEHPEFRTPSASHDILLGPESDRDAVRTSWDKLAPALKEVLLAGAPFNFQDEICARPPIGDDENALRHFRQWLKDQNIAPADLGATNIDDVMPIETPDALRERMKVDEPAARRLFYYTTRFRQQATTERLIWNSEELHRQVAAGVISSTLVADHPYFSGTGLGMGMDQQNAAWGGWHLAADWFDIGRRRAVDMIGIEDWLGLQFMYGPSFTWEGFQLMGFQAAMFRSASRGEQPIMAWITPSDERNLRLKAGSALCQGAKHFYYWTYGPTATSTENYWSDQPGSYPGMARLSRMLEFGEPIIAPGKPRATRVALLYSISSDLWQPLGYAQMLERRGLYFALVHEQFLVDMLTEEDVNAGRLADYRILYTADPCIRSDAANSIGQWVKDGGTLVATCAAGSRNEFGEPTPALAEVFGIAPEVTADCQAGDYRERGRLNDIPDRDRMKMDGAELGLIGVKVVTEARSAEAKAVFVSDGAPALLENRYGQGHAIYFACTPGVSYIKAAKFIRDSLAEKWPAEQRHALTRYANEAAAAPLVRLSAPVVEAGVYDAPDGVALVLANFTYEPIASLRVELPTHAAVKTIRSLTHGPVAFETVAAPSPWREEGYEQLHRFVVPLDMDDLLILETR